MSKKGLKDEFVLGIPEKEIPRWNFMWKMLISVFKINTCGSETMKRPWAQR